MRGRGPVALLALVLSAGCAASIPNVGDASITCATNADCLAGETCDTNVSPGICVAQSGTTASTGATTGTSVGTTSVTGTSGSTSGVSTSSGSTGGGGCVIDGGSFAEGAVNPADDCQLCETSTNMSVWSSASDQSACTSDGGNVCHQGVCTSACVISGSLVTPGSASPDNPCTVCNPDAGAESYTAAASLSACNVDGGNLCVAGSCERGCAIDGGFVAQWAFRDPLQAACCNAGVAASGWTSAFSGASGVKPTNFPNALAVGDFNGDGRADLAVSESSITEAFISQSDGGFLSVWNVSGISLDSIAVVVADFNQDGNSDLAVLSANNSTPAVDIFYGDGGGGFADAGALAALTGTQGLLASPLSSAFPDVLVSETALGGQVAIYPNNAGQIAGSGSVPVTLNPAAMCAAGFRDVSANDIAVLDNAGGGISIVLNESGGTIFRVTTPFVSPANATALTSALLPNSALPTLAVTGQDGGGGVVQIYLSLTDGGFTVGPSTSVTDAPAAIATFRRADAGSDTLVTASGPHGTIDVVIALDGGLASSASYPAGTKANALATGDFNGDSLTDLAVSDPNSGNVYILYGQCR